MKIGLICCPALGPQWAPLKLALLASYLRQNKYEAQCFDFNIDLYDSVSPEKRKEYWSMSNHHFWDNPDMNELINDVIIDEWVMKTIDAKIDIVAMSTYSSNYQITLIYIKKLIAVAPHIKVICGGPFCRTDHGTAQELLNTGIPSASTVGEGEDRLLELLDIYRDTGELKAIPGVLIKNEKGQIEEGGSRTAI